MSSASSAGGLSSAKEKRASRLDHYSAYLGKEGGGLSKHDLSGVVFAWGSESTGQLGMDILTNNGPNGGQPSVSLKVHYPRMVVSLKDEIIREICCGYSHTMAVNMHGQVFAWGLNENGQLGLGPDAPAIVRKPVLNIYLSNITKLSAGNEHSLALNKNSELYIWGGGGLTGLGDANKRSIPTKMDFFNRTKVVQAVCGGLHTVAITKDGDIYSWGSTEGGQLGLSLKMIDQLCPDRESPVMTPQLISSLQGTRIEQIACGEAHSLAMDSEGKIYGWGMSNYGQLGLGFSSDSFEPGIGMEKSKVYEPKQITHISNVRIIKLYCGATFSLFLTDKGDLYGCGMNDLGQLGLETQSEEMTLEKAKKGRHQQTSDVTLPMKVICFEGSNLSFLACGENHALGVSGDDRNMLWAWGMYRNGQLGLGEVTMKSNPRPVQALCSSQISRISCGSMHSLAIVGDSTQITTFSAQHYAHNNTINNPWSCDIRGLNFQAIPEQLGDNKEYQVPNDGEGKIKNPK